MNKEIRKRIREATKQILEEEKRKQKLLNTEINYGYLQELLDKVDENPNLTITIKLHSGDTIVLQQKSNPNNPFEVFDGRPTADEIEVY